MGWHGEPKKPIDLPCQRIAAALAAKERIAHMRAALDERIAQRLIRDDDIRAGLRERDDRPFVIPYGRWLRVKRAHELQKK
jgi:hypothetical protein